MRRVFAIEMYMTCILTATIAADNDIVWLSTECESMRVYEKCYSIEFVSATAYFHGTMCNMYLHICSNISTKCNLTAPNTAHNNNTNVLRRTQYTVMMHYQFGFASVAIHCHIAYLWLLICPFPISKIDQRLILVLLYFSLYEDLFSYAKSFEYKMDFIVKLCITPWWHT